MNISIKNSYEELSKDAAGKGIAFNDKEEACKDKQLNYQRGDYPAQHPKKNIIALVKRIKDPFIFINSI